MKSALDKVLHPLGGFPMLEHVLSSVERTGIAHRAVVLAPGMDRVSELVRAREGATGIFIQKEQLGTADGVLAAREALEGFTGDVIVLYGDTPLLRPETLRRLRQALAEGADIAVLGFEARDPGAVSYTHLTLPTILRV